LNYELGYSPLFHMLSCLARILDRPYMLGSFLAALGYGWALLKRHPYCLPPEAVRSLRIEQRRRLRQLVVSAKSGFVNVKD
jgi:hypothetical protein